MRRLLIAAVVLCGVVTGCSTPKNAPVVLGDGPETSYTPPPIAWSKCTNGLKAYGGDCGFLVVPLDYSRPAEMKIKIAVSRIVHTSDAGDYQGAVVVNLTSAGGSALGQSAFSKLLPDSVTSDYDWIGFDPRGVGSSEPALNCEPTGNYGRPAYVPTSVQDQVAWLKRSKDYSDACARTNSPLLEHATTTDSAQDLDSLRKALGQGRINYYGYWYGAYLGEVYSTMYPDRVRRMILDSSIDPSQVWFGFNFAQNAPLEQNFSAFCAWVATYDDRYHLGKTGAAVEQQYRFALEKLTNEPAGGVLGPDVWTDDFLLVYYAKNWDSLADAFSAYVDKGVSAPMKSLYDINYPLNNDNSFAMSLATECTDAPWPRDWDTWLSATVKSYKGAPFASWNNMWFVAGCQFWSVPPQKPAVVDGSKSPPMLMVLDSTIEPNTTYAGSLAVRKLFPNAVLVQSGGSSTGSPPDGSCSVGAALVAWLHDGTLPTTRKAGDIADLECPANALPDPTSAPPPAGR